VTLSTTDGRCFTVIQRAGLRHAVSLAPTVARLLADAGIGATDLGLIVCCVGPGSFTGVRIGMATAKGLALGARCHLQGVPSLDALAHRFSFFGGAVVPTVDAKKGRVYAALYRAGARVSEYLDLEPDALARRVAATEDALLVTGPHARPFHDLLAQLLPERRARLVLDPLPVGTDPQALLALGLASYRRRGPDPEPLEPLYLRPSEAELAGSGSRRSSPAP
jgi:tRNA threonylcarbamoyladenosine biosynthesis protein TsaB